MPKWYQGKVIDIQQESPTTRRFWLEVQDVNEIQFKAGQFIVTDLPVHEKRRYRWRSYSIANHPDGSNILELIIVRLEGGLGTQYLFEEIEIGSEIKFKEPSGVFCLPTEVEKDLVFVCTGTGVAPFRSMLHDIIQHDKPHKKIHLIFGTRKEAGILYREEFEEIQKAHDWFTYDVALSREENWEGRRGYVHAIYESAYAGKNTDAHFYICGWQIMVDEAIRRLKEMKIPEEQIHHELYG